MTRRPPNPELLDKVTPEQLELDRLARWMDSVFVIPGLNLRFGLDALLGLVPGLGDAVTSVVSLYILNAAQRLGVPRTTMLRMAANIALDYVIGSVPLLGDLFDVYWKANQKNVTLLNQHLRAAPDEARKARRSDRLFLFGLGLGLVLLLIGSVTVAFLLASWIVGLLA